MIDFPGSKINLGLYITSKRADGYHNLETVFFPIHWSDVLEIIPSDTLKLDITGLQVAGDIDQNLCIKAWKLLHKDFGIPPVHIHLHKVVPMGAGLGGGSADGAATLKILNSLFSLNLRDESLVDYAQQLGSDCAFFIYKKPVFAHGRGEITEPLSLSLQGYVLVLITPGIESNTASAYRYISVAPASTDLRKLPTIPVQRWQATLQNQFTTVVSEKIPSIQNLIQFLYDKGAIYAEMSGSGSAVFGLFPSNSYDPIQQNELPPDATIHTELLS